MTRNELKSVKNFKIWNEHGSIEYPEPTDLLGVNLDDLVFIEHKQAEVYPEHIERQNKKPRVGEKLNKRAIITLNNITSSEEKLKAKISKIEDATFLSYDKVQKILKFEVQHFTRYAVNDDNSDDELEEKKVAEAYPGRFSFGNEGQF